MKIKYILEIITSKPTRDNNINHAFRLINTADGKEIHGIDVHESNITEALRIFNGEVRHVKNYWLAHIEYARPRFHIVTSGWESWPANCASIAERIKLESRDWTK